MTVPLFQSDPRKSRPAPAHPRRTVSGVTLCTPMLAAALTVILGACSNTDIAPSSQATTTNNRAASDAALHPRMALADSAAESATVADQVAGHATGRATGHATGKALISRPAHSSRVEALTLYPLRLTRGMYRSR